MSSAASNPSAEVRDDSGGSPLGLLPDFFERYFAFYNPGHQQGIVPSRIKELARLKIARLNDCDT
ncbi:hypothetical protein MK489_02215 [Myxococcota bacterium]|nr:hypothetical protein [Myxococcota bacterium]